MAELRDSVGVSRVPVAAAAEKSSANSIICAELKAYGRNPETLSPKQAQTFATHRMLTPRLLGVSEDQVQVFSAEKLLDEMHVQELCLGFSGLAYMS